MANVLSPPPPGSGRSTGNFLIGSSGDLGFLIPFLQILSPTIRGEGGGDPTEPPPPPFPFLFPPDHPHTFSKKILGWAFALFGREQFAHFFPKKSEKLKKERFALFALFRSFGKERKSNPLCVALFVKSKRAICSLLLVLKEQKGNSLFVALFKRAKE